MGDLWNFRNRSLYVDRVKRKWSSPLDTKRVDAQSWIGAARDMKIKFEPLCKTLPSPPKEVLRNIQEFLENELLPSIMERFRENAEELYKNKLITKKLYDVILNER